jgi:hypothetical protein
MGTGEAATVHEFRLPGIALHRDQQTPGAEEQHIMFGASIRHNRSSLLLCEILKKRTDPVFETSENRTQSDFRYHRRRVG